MSLASGPSNSALVSGAGAAAFEVCAGATAAPAALALAFLPALPFFLPTFLFLPLTFARMRYISMRGDQHPCLQVCTSAYSDVKHLLFDIFP